MSEEIRDGYTEVLLVKYNEETKTMIFDVNLPNIETSYQVIKIMFKTMLENGISDQAIFARLVTDFPANGVQNG